MSIFLYLLAAGCLIIGLVDSQVGAYQEAAVLLILAPVFAVAGFVVGRATTKVCPRCSERVKKAANACKHCGSELHDGERTPRPVNQQRI